MLSKVFIFSKMKKIMTKNHKWINSRSPLADMENNENKTLFSVFLIFIDNVKSLCTDNVTECVGANVCICYVNLKYKVKYRRGKNVNEASFFFGYLLKIIHSSSQRRVAEDRYHSFLHFTYVRKLNSFCISFYFHCSINLHVPLCW